MKSNDSYTVSTGASYSGLQDYYEHLAAGGQYVNWTTNPKLLAQVPPLLQEIVSHLARNYVNNRSYAAASTLISYAVSAFSNAEKADWEVHNDQGALQSSSPVQPTQVAIRKRELSNALKATNRDNILGKPTAISTDSLTEELVNKLRVLKNSPLENSDFPSSIVAPVIAYLKNGIGNKISKAIGGLKQLVDLNAGEEQKDENADINYANIITGRLDTVAPNDFRFPPNEVFSPQYVQNFATAEAVIVFNLIKSFLINASGGNPSAAFDRELTQEYNLTKNAGIYLAQQQKNLGFGKDDLKPSGSTLPTARDMSLALQKTQAAAQEAVLKVDIQRRKMEQELADKGVGYYYRPLFVEPQLGLEKVDTNMKEPNLPLRMQMKDYKCPGKIQNLSNNNQPNPVVIQNLPVWRNKTKDKKYFDKIMINDKSLLKFKLNATFERTGYLPKKKRVE